MKYSQDSQNNNVNVKEAEFGYLRVIHLLNKTKKRLKNCSYRNNLDITVMEKK